MMKFCSYLKADLKRMLCSAKPFLSVILTVGVLLLATLEGIDLHAGVLYIFSLVMYGMPAMMILVCAAVAYADSFCEDVEHKYMMQQIIRGDVGAYVFAKMSGIFLAAMFTTAFGIFLFVNFLLFSIHDTALLYGFDKTICDCSPISCRAVGTAFYGAKCILSVCIWNFGGLFLFQCAVYAGI